MLYAPRQLAHTLVDSAIHFRCDRDCIALNELDVVYAIIGGSACRILGSQRVTEDVDLVIALTETTPSAEDLVDALCQRENFVEVDTFGVKTPAVKLNESEFPVEIFDSNEWVAQCPHYSRVAQDWVENTLPSGTTTYIFSTTWLLREKIHAVHQRGHLGTHKFETDLADIVFLASLIQPIEAKTGFLDFTTPHNKDFFSSLNAFLVRNDVPVVIRAIIKSLCKTEPSSGEVTTLVLNIASIPFWCLVYLFLAPIPCHFKYLRPT